ncbi:MAG: hypothetical protein L0H36_01605 [bacterium]|nr:hypothetical protein [bacterium]MDN5835312.1 hypothetical protein [bacterium]
MRILPGSIARHKFFRRSHDPIWQMQLGILVIMALQFFTDSSFLPYDKIWIIGVEAVLMVSILLATHDGYSRISKLRRSLALTFIAIVAVINIFSLFFLIQDLLFSADLVKSGPALLLNAFIIYVTNIFVFALWYWEIDGGGPDRRVIDARQRDFVFPQMIHSGVAADGWLPGYIDYLYLSTTNVTNFASADTLPLSHRAKLLMMIQALVSVAIVVLVAARAIGVL